MADRSEMRANLMTPRNRCMHGEQRHIAERLDIHDLGLSRTRRRIELITFC